MPRHCPYCLAVIPTMTNPLIQLADVPVRQTPAIDRNRIARLAERPLQIVIRIRTHTRPFYLIDYPAPVADSLYSHRTAGLLSQQKSGDVPALVLDSTFLNVLAVFILDPCPGISFMAVECYNAHCVPLSAAASRLEVFLIRHSTAPSGTLSYNHSESFASLEDELREESHICAAQTLRFAQSLP